MWHAVLDRIAVPTGCTWRWANEPYQFQVLKQCRSSHPWDLKNSACGLGTNLNHGGKRPQCSREWKHVCATYKYSKYLFALWEAHWPVGKTWTSTATKHKSRTRQLICKFGRKRIHISTNLIKSWTDSRAFKLMKKSIPWYPSRLETFQHIFAASDSAMGHTLTIGSVGSWMNSQLISTNDATWMHKGSWYWFLTANMKTLHCFQYSITCYGL